MIPGGATPMLTAAELQEIGFALVVYPNVVTYAYAHAATEVLSELLRTGSIAGFQDRMIVFDEFNALVGLPEIRAEEDRYYADVRAARAPN
jgi:methylisocitrate lyase